MDQANRLELCICPNLVGRTSPGTGWAGGEGREPEDPVRSASHSLAFLAAFA